jgi:signal transduction histidine kinase
MGFLFFSSRKPRVYHNAHCDLFMQIAGQVATIIEKGRLYQRLVEVTRLKDHFVGIVAHDLSSPISVIKGYLHVLRRAADGSACAAHDEVLGILDRTCESMIELIRHLLNINIIESGHLTLQHTRLSAASFLEESARAASLLSQRKSITVKLDLAPDLGEVWLDPDRMAQVMNNLFTNAIKFSHPGTEITLRARIVEGDLDITVIDQGLGIPPQDISHLFSSTMPRPRVRPTGGETSTGLGLEIVKSIVEAHGGQMHVVSEPGRGSEFGFRLTRGEPPVAESFVEYRGPDSAQR